MPIEKDKNKLTGLRGNLLNWMRGRLAKLRIEYSATNN